MFLFFIGRTSSLIDKTDLLIMELVSKKKEYSISDLSREVGLAYKNAFIHIKKLENAGFVTVTSLGIGKKSIVNLVQIKLPGSKNTYITQYELLLVGSGKKKVVDMNKLF